MNTSRQMDCGKSEPPGRSIVFVVGTLAVGGSESKIVKIANAIARNGCRATITYLQKPDTLLAKVDSSVSTVNLDRRGKFSFKSLNLLRGEISDRRSAVVAVNFYPLLYVVPIVKMMFSGSHRSICLVNASKIVDGQWIFEMIYAPLLRRCDLLVFGCEAQKNQWSARYKLSKTRSIHIYNGVDEDYFSPDAKYSRESSFRRKLSISSDAIVVGSVGRLVPDKNFELLIEAFARVGPEKRNAYLVLAGDGPQRDRLDLAAKRWGVENRVVFLGMVDNVRSVLADFDIFILSSRSEIFSNAALEAMSMGCAVILSDVGGAREMLEDGKSGLLFPPGDVMALKSAICRLIDAPALRGKLGGGARTRVLENFRFSQMLRHYNDLMLI